MRVKHQKTYQRQTKEQNRNFFMGGIDLPPIVIEQGKAPATENVLLLFLREPYEETNAVSTAFAKIPLSDEVFLQAAIIDAVSSRLCY